MELCQQTERQSQCARQNRKRQQIAPCPADQPHDQLPREINELVRRKPEWEALRPLISFTVSLHFVMLGACN